MSLSHSRPAWATKCRQISLSECVLQTFSLSHWGFLQLSISFAHPDIFWVSPVNIVFSLCLYSSRLVISLSSTQASFIPDSKFCTCSPLTKNAHVYISCPSQSLPESSPCRHRLWVACLLIIWQSWAGWSHSIAVRWNCIDVFTETFFSFLMCYISKGPNICAH